MLATSDVVLFHTTELVGTSCEDFDVEVQIWSDLMKKNNTVRQFI